MDLGEIIRTEVGGKGVEYLILDHDVAEILVSLPMSLAVM